MAWLSLGEAAQGSRRKGFDEIDVRRAVERFYGQRVGPGAVYCEEARGGAVVVRVQSAAGRQEAQLLVGELTTWLADEVDFTLKALRVRF